MIKLKYLWSDDLHFPLPISWRCIQLPPRTVPLIQAETVALALRQSIIYILPFARSSNIKTNHNREHSRLSVVVNDTPRLSHARVQLCCVADATEDICLQSRHFNIGSTSSSKHMLYQYIFFASALLSAK